MKLNTWAILPQPSQVASKPVVEAGEELLQDLACKLEAGSGPRCLGQRINRGWMDCKSYVFKELRPRHMFPVGDQRDRADP
jgi:hypothetical protein